MDKILLLITTKPVTMRPVKFMDQNSEIQEAKRRPFWQQYLFIMAVDTIIVFLGVLLLGNIQQISNLYFWSTLALLVIAAIPIFIEVGTRVKSIGSVAKDSDEAAEQLRERQSKFDRGARITYLFGLASVTTFILAVLTLAIR
jgi:magnesium-transporting ATPase (P-type)